MISIYEVTYILVCVDDGLISHTIKSIKEVMPSPVDTGADDDDDEDSDGTE